MYTLRTANPVIQSDHWYLMEAFISKKFDGRLHWTDYFVKRVPSEVAGPVNKALFTFNVNVFAADFHFEAMVSFAAMVICGLYFVAVAWSIGRPLQLAEAALISLIPLLHFSLNSIEIYTWPMVMLFYVGLPFGLLLISLSRLARGALGMGAIFVACIVCLVTMDVGGSLICVAIILALIFEAIRCGGWRKNLLRTLPILAGVVVYNLAYAASMPPYDPRSVPTPSLISFVSAHSAEAWKLIILPAASSVAHPDLFFARFGRLGMFAVALLVITLHMMFWVSVWRLSSWRHATFVAVCLMLFAYGCTAGVFAARVPTLGWDYLKQLRYVEYYQLANVALVLQWLSVRQATGSAQPRWTTVSQYAPYVRRLLPGAALLAVMFLQLGMIWYAWKGSPYARAYFQGMAQTLFCLANHPEVEKPICTPLIPICSRVTEDRNRVLSLIKDHQLNVFSPDFQRRHSMHPNPAANDSCLPPIVRARNRGPLVIDKIADLHIGVDPQTGGKAVIGSIIGAGFQRGDMVVIDGNRSFETVFGDQGWMTFAIPISEVNPASFTLQVSRTGLEDRSESVNLSVNE